jgi:hypothetical protein
VPVTENGCLRILSQPAYPFPGLTVACVRDMPAKLTGIEGHRFWPDSVSVLESNRFDLNGTNPKSLTDLDLLGPACAFNGV